MNQKTLQKEKENSHTQKQDMSKEEIKVVMLPWSAFGHLLPFFNLSLALANSGIRVSYVSTPRNISRLPMVPPALENLLNFVELPLPTSDVLEGGEATVDIPYEKIEHLKVAYDLLRKPFEELVVELSPDWVVADMIPHWVGEVAMDKQVKLVHFSVFAAASYVFLGNPECLLVGEGKERLRPSWESMTSPPQWVDFPSMVAYKKHEAFSAYQATYEVNASGVSDGDRIFKVLTSSQAMAIRSCPEFEPRYLDKLSKILRKPVIPVGLLLPQEKKPDEGIGNGYWEGIFNWLDEQEPKSVVYVAFGSEVKLSKDHVHEIAYGLELSGLPFLWALGRPQWASTDTEALPPSYRERASRTGRVSFGWAPQPQILSHPAIGGTLFHSGWGSIVESLQYGHALVLLPFVVDQPLMARLLVEKGLGVEVERGEDGSFSRADIAGALELAMVADEGRGVRDRAREAAETFGNRELQDHYLANFVEFLKNK